VTKDMVASMAAKPIIFAMANPDPENHRSKRWRQGAATTPSWRRRSDYPNQSNNVLGFHLHLRGALDVAQHDQHGDEDRRRPRAAELAREERPRTRSRRPTATAEIRARLHYPGAVRSSG